MIFGFLASAAGWIIRNASSGWLNKILTTLTGTDDNATQIAIRQIDSEIVSRKAARDIRLATAGFWEMRLITFGIAFCALLHFSAVTLDTVFQFHWRVPKYPTPMDEWEGLILLSFFGVQLAQRGLTTLAAVLLGRR